MKINERPQITKAFNSPSLFRVLNDVNAENNDSAKGGSAEKVSDNAAFTPKHW
jgi:hypothetical protein